MFCSVAYAHLVVNLFPFWLQQTLLDQTMDHLLSCSSKLLTGVADSVKPSRLSKESGLNNNRDHHRGQKKTEIQPNVSSPSDDGKWLNAHKIVKCTFYR